MKNYFSYTYRKNNSYRSYLKDKSHVDRIEMAIHTGIKKLVTSNETLAQHQLKVIEKFGTEIPKGFMRISTSLDVIARNIKNLGSVCEYGFTQIDIQLNFIDNSINRLIEIAKTPDQTWALEQYSIAQDALRRNLVEDAIVYVNRAICGYRERPGYPLDHRFYMFRGLIRLGNYNNFTSTMIDLGAATEDFLLAAKYSEHDNPRDHARSLGLAGWASYCDGRMVDAERHMRKSIETYPGDDRSRFELSKLLFHIGKDNEALKQFSTVLRHDWKYGLRAGSDDDFLKYRNDVENIIKSYAKDLKRDISSLIHICHEIKSSFKQIILYHGFLRIDQSAVTFFEKLQARLARLDDIPVSDLVNLKEIAFENLTLLERELERAERSLTNEITRLKEHDNMEELGFVGAVGGIVTTIGICIYFITELGQISTILDLFYWIIKFLLGFFFAPIAGWMIFGGIALILRDMRTSTKANQLRNAASKIEIDRRKLKAWCIGKRNK